MLSGKNTPVFEQPVVAAISTDGSTTGDGALLTQLLSRRSSMLSAVELAMETLRDTGHTNVPRHQLVREFEKLADSVRRWYLPVEQRIGADLYQSIAGKLLNLPEGPLGSPFPPTAFV